MEKEKADAVITAYLEKIYGFAVKKCFSYAEAEELASDIVEEVYTTLLRRDGIYNIEGYIWRISEHTWARYVSSKKRHEGVSIDGVEIPYEDELPSDDAADELMKLRLGIAYLTEVRRRTVYLFYFENRSVRDIASELSMPEGTVKWHLNKARKELKEAFRMERKIGKLGMNPVKARGFGHNGRPGDGGGPEKYLSDQLDLNIVYSCYYEPRTAEEIADELGVTPVFLSDRIAKLEGSGFLVREKGGRFTTYVEFSPLTYSLAEEEELNRKQLEAAKILADEYYPVVSDAVDRLGEIYLPTGNRQLAKMSIFLHKVCTTPVSSAGRDISRYYIKTPDGGEFIAYAVLEQTCSDPDYQPTIPMENWLCCGTMNRWSDKYPVGSWSYDTKWTSRQGAWENNLGEDYEKLYEYMTHQLPDIPANAEKLARLRERGMIDESGRVAVMVARTGVRDEIESIPSIGESVTRRYADAALEYALNEAKKYPPQMQDLIVHEESRAFSGSVVALMARKILVDRGVWKPLADAEKVAVDLMVFSDVLPTDE
ncbi:MAG: sigma-70 family RNA polymerase sigma factor [Clostridia bacterium]|nr:sigma-70 family RNA polymerase sigma factor [Clostridia bacterium]